MPVTMTLVGTTLQVDIIDENFEQLQDIFRSGLALEDFDGQITRFQVSRWTAGRIVSQQAFARPIPLKQTVMSAGYFDLTFRHTGIFDQESWYVEDVGFEGVIAPFVEADGTRKAYAMELLGKPGPSFHFQWQEDERDAPTTAVGWPPDYWPINRYEKGYCFSKWLTVPYASTRVYVDEPCTVRITATCRGSLNWFRNQLRRTNINSADESSAGLSRPSADGFPFNRSYWNFGRFGLIVDTNPVLYTDEFPNTNPNIEDAEGDTAPYVSWKIVEDTTFNLAQRAQVRLVGEVVLKGRRWYNFAMKFRDAAHHGFVYTDQAITTFSAGNWESDSGHVNSPTWANSWTDTFTPWLPPADASYDDFTALDHARISFYPSFVNLWENTGIGVEFFYGRDELVYDSTNAEFTTKPE